MKNNDLRIKIMELVVRSGEGHIPSSFSIVDIIEYLYSSVLKFNPKNPCWSERDFFILSKGHGCGALYVVLHKHGFLSDEDLLLYSKPTGILGGHPDMTIVPGAEASTGSLGHGFPTAVGLALGLKIQKKENRVYCLLGDGECHEGTIWEAANVGANRKLNNLCAIIDWNGSAAQLMPNDNLPQKWSAFGWETYVIDGHSNADFDKTFCKISQSKDDRPKAVIAKTIKGKGVKFMEGHGVWHHKIPSPQEFQSAKKELSS